MDLIIAPLFHEGTHGGSVIVYIVASCGACVVEIISALVALCFMRGLTQWYFQVD